MGEQQSENGAPAETPRDRKLEGAPTDPGKARGAAQADRSFEAKPIDGGEDRQDGDSGEAWLQEGEAGSRRGGGEDALTTDAAAPHERQG